MPSNFTEHYQLSQWSKDDQVKMEDFNADNAKLDAAIAEKVNIITGTYAGDGQASRFIELGVTPRAVLLLTSTGYTHGLNVAYGGLVLPGHPVKDGTYSVCEIVNNGFKVYYKSEHAYSNSSSSTYYYLAFV